MSRAPGQSDNPIHLLIAIGLLRRFALIDTISVGVAKFSPPIPHALGKVGMTVRLARSELADWPAEEEPLEALPG